MALLVVVVTCDFVYLFEPSSLLLQIAQPNFDDGKLMNGEDKDINLRGLSKR